jgi:hypothetical protein
MYGVPQRHGDCEQRDDSSNGKIFRRQLQKGSGLGRPVIRRIRRGKEVKPITLSKIIKFLDEQKPKTKPFSEDTLADLPDLKELRDLLDPKKDKRHIALLDKRIRKLTDEGPISKFSPTTREWRNALGAARRGLRHNRA